ncbi:HAD family phosphatase [Rhizobium sp. AG855]|uniref:HAD family hydrolase n=1 Tax=Rhizobium sp. AG855 TaxID=2183898 RepID=UPI000FF0885A|nr:HAD family phosphatase [Rhizobium sp. AG855]RKE78199.1 HAD superfamily hydrolase (TIGR01509 family) [Rhizobium sp. AG855]
MMPMQPIQLVIFDCDGVLVDSEPIALEVLVDMLAVKGITMDTDGAAERFLGRSIASMAEVVKEEFRVEIDQVFLSQMREALYARFRQELQPIARIERVIAGLKDRGIAWCVASSSQRERIELSLTATGLLDHFKHAIFSATMVKNGKPAPDLFLYAAAAMGTDPSACVVVEDSPAGIVAAQAAGMAVCAFTGGSHTNHASYQAALLALHPDARFDAMEELLHFVGGARRPEDHSDA